MHCVIARHAVYHLSCHAQPRSHTGMEQVFTFARGEMVEWSFVQARMPNRVESKMLKPKKK